MKSNRNQKPLPAGVILAPVNVGTKTTCPPGEICVGKSWGQGYCAIFGKETERMKNYSGKFKRTYDHKYLCHKCPECIEARKDLFDIISTTEIYPDGIYPIAEIQHSGYYERLQKNERELK